MARLVPIEYGIQDDLGQLRQRIRVRMVQDEPCEYIVTDNFNCVLNRDGSWEHNPLSSLQTEEFKERTRFDLDTAFGLAVNVRDDSLGW
jgi:hypothetical protein